jgi:hypothetical protein
MGLVATVFRDINIKVGYLIRSVCLDDMNADASL